MLTKQKLPKTVLKNLLQKFNLGKVIRVEPLATSGNIAYTIESSKEKYLLRLSPSGPRWRSKGEIAAELEIVGYLLKNNFPLPGPIAMKNGEQIIAWRNHFGYLRKFVDGEHKQDPNSEEVRKFGELIGWFHCLIKNYRTKNKREHVWDLKETRRNFQESKKLILRSNFERKEEFVKRLEKEFLLLSFPDNLPSGMIHEDLGKRHILWQKEKIVAVIDFDRSYYGKLILDLGQACRGWCFIDDWSKWSNDNFQALLSGYQKRRNLAALEKKYLVDAIKFGVLERSLSFCLRFIEVTQDREDEAFASDSLFKLIDLLENKRSKVDKFLVTN